MRFAIVGCGYVADYYAGTLSNHRGLELAGVFDRDPERARRFSSYSGAPVYATLDALLADPAVELVANLTNPRSHFAVSAAALEAGKHVYSEKPLAMTLPEARQLVELSCRRGRLLAAAPCNLLGETAQTMWKALREKKIGTPRLVYAEIDDGPIALLNYRRWISASGAPWPFRDEFETGCTLEHAGYYLSWLLAFFGPARRIASFACTLQEDKGVELETHTPDLAVACVEFESGVVARLTCSIYGSHDHRLRIYGDQGVLETGECWDYASPVYLTRRTPWALRAARFPNLARLAGLGPRRIQPVRAARFRSRGGRANRMDFCRGIADLAAAAAGKRPPRLGADFSLHLTELVLAMQDPSLPRDIKSTFEPVEPMPWA